MLLGEVIYMNCVVLYDFKKINFRNINNHEFFPNNFQCNLFLFFFTNDSKEFFYT